MTDVTHARRRWTTHGVCAAVVAAATGCVVLPLSPSDGSLPAIGECGLSPNYADSALADQAPPQLLRWRSFRVRAHLDLAAVPDALKPVYELAARDGAESWSRATDGRVGAIAWVAGSDAQIVLRIAPGAPSARTTVRVTGRELVGATTEVFRPGDDLDRASRGGQAAVSLVLSQVVGHEVGHALGILMHSPNPGDLMAPHIRVGTGGNAISEADRHTLLQAYCQ